ncbi:MAG: ribosome assembly RNA-binding protein YhbY [Lachnospiraceae bacterium]|nr:ribosome assembly RNA-binding protein YhbY [Lachnospiraceae bacterium]
MELTSKQRAYLKSLASNIDPAFNLGKASVTPETITALDEFFSKNELLKISVLKNCEDNAGELAEIIAGRTRSTVVQVIGRKIVLYKPDKENPKIELPKASKKA